jgi:hypothetical protein
VFAGQATRLSDLQMDQVERVLRTNVVGVLVCAREAAKRQADPEIAGYTRGGFTGVRIGQLRVMALVLGHPGPARPVITAGVAPTASDEVALGESAGFRALRSPDCCGGSVSSRRILRQIPRRPWDRRPGASAR